jgi:hypothetical protein
MSTHENDPAVISFPATEIEQAPKANYQAVKFNALKHGILSRYTILPHEEAGEFANLLAALKVCSNFANYPIGSGSEEIPNQPGHDHLFDRAFGREGARAGSQKAHVRLLNGGGKFQCDEW